MHTESNEVPVRQIVPEYSSQDPYPNLDVRIPMTSKPPAQLSLVTGSINNTYNFFGPFTNADFHEYMTSPQQPRKAPDPELSLAI